MSRCLALCAFALCLLVGANASAFCGFYVSGGEADLYNEATQVVLMRNGQMTALSMQNNYKGPTEDFAMVVPVPVVLQEENVRTLDKAIFDKIDRLTAPRLVEYWEKDPCKPDPPMRPSTRGVASIGMIRSSSTGEPSDVVVEAQFSVGEYDIVILSAKEANALAAWLKANKYKIPDGAAPVMQPYIESGMYFFVAKVNAQKVKFENGEAVLSPLRFHYENKEFSLPIRLGMINSAGKQDLIAYILAKNQRFETANYTNVTIPTNLEVNPAVKENFGGFYEALFSRTIEENPKSVVTEYSWAAASCDPCPPGIIGGATVNTSDLTTLGALDVGASAFPNGWVVTRLHARYAPDEIGEDLVFRVAEPILGGREIRAQDGSVEKGASKGSQNNFQGRYIMRNEWDGPVECENPEFGRWGGPPGGQAGINSAPSANTRGQAVTPPKLSLDQLLKSKPSADPQTDLKSTKEETNPVNKSAQEQAKASEKREKKASGCATGGEGPANPLAALALGLFAITRRRRDSSQGTFDTCSSPNEARPPNRTPNPPEDA